MRVKKLQFMTMLKILMIFNICVLFGFPISVFSENLGVYGSIYSIEEPDMLSAIHNKLVSMQESGVLAAQKRNFIARSIKHIERPTPVTGVSDIGNQKPIVRLFNPSIVLNKSITNLNGDVIAYSGEKINPLKIHPFNEMLIFIDGDNAKEIQWAVNTENKNQSQFSDIKIILTSGDINQSAKALHQRVYFDQDGVLCKRFGIKHTPTMVYQATENGVKIPRLIIKESSYE